MLRGRDKVGKDGKKDRVKTDKTVARDLILGVAVMRRAQVVASCCSAALLEEGQTTTFADVLVKELHPRVPPEHRWFSRCWDQVMFVVRIDGPWRFVIAAYECMGRFLVRDLLTQLHSELLLSVPILQQATPHPPPPGWLPKAEKRIKSVQTSLQGVPPPREVLVLYPGAPKAFLTKDGGQTPDYLVKPGGNEGPTAQEIAARIRLLKALEAVDKDSDDEDSDDDEEEFVFSMDAALRRRAEMFGEAPSAGGKEKEKEKKGKKGEEDDDDEDDFVFNIPQRSQTMGRSSTSTPAAAAAAASGQVAGAANGGAGGGKDMASPLPKMGPARQVRSFKKTLSPSISMDFTRNGAKVSPDISAAMKPAGSNAAGKSSKQHSGGSGRGSRPISGGYSSDFTSMKGSKLMGLLPAHIQAAHQQQQQEQQQGHQQHMVHTIECGVAGRKVSGGRRTDGKVRGLVEDIAPSGLSWEDEIASQLAAAGVMVAKGSSAEDEDDEETGDSGRERGEEEGGGKFSMGARARAALGLRPGSFGSDDEGKGGKKDVVGGKNSSPMALDKHQQQMRRSLLHSASVSGADRGGMSGLFVRGFRRTFSRQTED